MRLAKPSGRLMIPFFKLAEKETLIFISHGAGNLLDRQIGIEQKGFCLFKPLLEQQFLKGTARFFMNEPAEHRQRLMKVVGNLRKLRRFIIGIEIGQRGLHHQFIVIQGRGLREGVHMI